MLVLNTSRERWQDLHLGCSEYLALRLGRADDLGPPPALDLESARDLQRFLLEAARRGLLRSAHDCSEGGLAVAIAECCIGSGFGFAGPGPSGDNPADLADVRVQQSQNPKYPRHDIILFGETQSVVVLSCRPEDNDAVFSLLGELSIRGSLALLGTVGGDTLSWCNDLFGDLSVSVKELARAWNTPF